MDRELVQRVTAAIVLASIPVGAVAALLAGASGAVGALAGALIALAGFRWIARAARLGAARLEGGRPGPLWVLGLGLRHLTLFALIAGLLWSGVAHPAALVAGLSLLPPAVIVVAWRALGTAV
jgi:hypothetical protein